MDTYTYRHPRLVALIILVLFVSGLSALLTLGRQEDPTITNLFATVKTAFPGAEPQRVESLVTIPLEETLREIAEIDIIASVSSTGQSVVAIELRDTLDAERIAQTWSEIRDALEDASARFPAGAQSPEFSAETGAFAAIVALSTRHDGVPMPIVGRYADELAERLRNVPGTRSVEVFGAPEEEILVTLDGHRLAALGLTPQSVSAAIRAADAKGAAGQVRGRGNDLVIALTGEIEAPDRVRDVVVQQTRGGAVTRVGDIATVTRGERRPVDSLALHDGRPALLVAARLEDGLQVDRWMTDVRARLDEANERMPSSISMTLTFDQSRYTAERLADVGANMALGLALVVGVLLLTLGVRAALIVALILPVVTLATMLTMRFLDLPIHQMSVTGLIVALGLLVDAGIVMTDEVARRLRDGESRLTAVGAATRRLFAPLLASTLTTALSFMPMILLPGPAGDFVGSIAIAVVVMLLWSFVIAVTVTPALAGHLIPDRDSRGLLARGIGSGAIGRGFERSLVWAARRPLQAVSVSLVLPVLGFLAMPTLTAQFFPGVDRDQFHIEVELGPGTALAETRRTVEALDARLRSEPDIATVTWVVGQSAPAFYYNITGGRERAPAYAQALVRTGSPQATERLLPGLQRTLAALAPDAQVLVRGLVQGPPVTAPVELRLIGPDLDELAELGTQLRAILAQVGVVTTTRATVSEPAPKVSIIANEPVVRLLGLDLSTVTEQLRASLDGITGGSLVEGTDQLAVRVRLGEQTRGDLDAVRDLPITLPPATTGGSLGVAPLSALAEVSLVPSSPAITRRNAERVNTVQAFIVHGVLPEEALSEARARIAESGFELPPGYRLEIGGDSDARSDTVDALVAPLGLIVTLSIAVVVMTFDSFRLTAIAFVVCGLAAGLSLFSLAVFQYPFGINGIIGVIGSIGVSINAAIIILTALQADPRSRQGEVDAMVAVLMGSSRHIVSTTVTTFGGFLPLILAGGAFWPPFAMAVAGGVLLSTVVSFYFVPPMFKLVFAHRARTERGINRRNALATTTT